MKQVLFTNWVFDNLLLQFKWACETSRRQLQEGSNSCPNLTPTWAKILDALDLSYTVLCKLYTETSGKSSLSLRRKMNEASVRERSWPRWCKVPSAPWSLSIHHLLSSVSQLVFPFISLATPVRLRDTAVSETQQPQRHSSLRDTAVARFQLFFSNLARSRTPVIKSGA